MPDKAFTPRSSSVPCLSAPHNCTWIAGVHQPRPDSLGAPASPSCPGLGPAGFPCSAPLTPEPEPTLYLPCGRPDVQEQPCSVQPCWPGAGWAGVVSHSWSPGSFGAQPGSQVLTPSSVSWQDCPSLLSRPGLGFTPGLCGWDLAVGCAAPFSTPPHAICLRPLPGWSCPGRRVWEEGRWGGSDVAKPPSPPTGPPPGSLPSPAGSPQPFLINGPGAGWGPILRMSWRSAGAQAWLTGGLGPMGPRGGWRPGQWQWQQGLHGRAGASHQDPDPWPGAAGVESGAAGAGNPGGGRSKCCRDSPAWAGGSLCSPWFGPMSSATLAGP